MKKILILLAIFVFSCVYGQRGNIQSLRYSDDGYVTVSGYADRTMWLGFTVNPDKATEEDFRAKKVKGSYSVKFKVSSFLKASKRLFNVDNMVYDMMEHGSEPFELTYVAALWTDKISSRECKRRNGSECYYCRKNGYHMEGRVDRKTGEL